MLFGRWGVFYTQQHGDNNTFEIIRDPQFARDDRDDDRRDDADE